MDNHLFRRRRSGLLKTLLSACLALLCLLMIQKFKRVEKDDRGVKNWWCADGQECALSKDKQPHTKSSPSANNHNNNNNNDSSSVVLGEVDTDAPQPRVTPSPATWDVHVMNCSEDAALKTEDWFLRLDARFQEFVLHRHCRYFPMLINHPETCRGGDGDVRLLMVVKSVIEQHDRRDAVRKTWGRELTTGGGKKTKTLFLLAKPSEDKDVRNLQKLLEYEDQIHGDILQWDFTDTFFNLTLKEVNFLKWFLIHCPDVEFVFKGDDDVFVHTNNLLDLITFRTDRGQNASDLLIGDTISKANPIRNRQSKYYIPKELYNKPYPPYVGGGGFLMSGQLARRLFEASESVELYPIDDVFLGVCLEKLHLTPEIHPGFRTFGIARRKSNRLNSEPCLYRGLIVVHKLSPQELLHMWALVHQEDLVCAARTLA